MVLWSMMHPLMLSKISLRTNIRIKLNKHAVFVVTFEPIIDWGHCFKWWARIWLQVIFCQLFLICLDWFLALVLYNAIIISIKYLHNPSLTLENISGTVNVHKLKTFHIILVRGALNILETMNKLLITPCVSEFEFCLLKWRGMIFVLFPDRRALVMNLQCCGWTKSKRPYWQPTRMKRRLSHVCSRKAWLILQIDLRFVSMNNCHIMPYRCSYPVFLVAIARRT